MGGKDVRTILIVGGSGLLGLNLGISLRSGFHCILGLHHRSSPISFLEVRKANLSDPFERSVILDDCAPDIIINAAGLTSVERCQSEPQYADEVNHKLASALASDAYSRGIKFVHISTDHLFDGTKSLYLESEPVSPVNVYGSTKVAAEQSVRAENPNALIIRTNFYGWGPSYKPSFSDLILKSVRNHKPINLFTDAFFTPISTHSLAEKIVYLLNSGSSGTFNLCSNKRISKYEFGQKLCRVFSCSEKYLKRSVLKQRSDLVLRPLDLSLSDQKIRALDESEGIDVERDILTVRMQEKELKSILSR